MGTRNREGGFYIPDELERFNADVAVRQLSKAARLSQGGTWTPEQRADADKLAGFVSTWGTWAKATPSAVAEQRERLELDGLFAPALIGPLAELRASLQRYELKCHEKAKRAESSGSLPSCLVAQLDAQLDDLDPVVASGPLPRPERRKVDAASRRTTQNRPRKLERGRTLLQREPLLAAARGLDLDHGPQDLLVALIDFADARGTCWKSTRTLAARLGRSVRSVRRWRSELEALGLVTVDNFRRPNGRQGACTYRLQLDLLTVARADTADHVIRADTAGAERAQLVEVAAETPESALRPNVIRADTMSAPEQKNYEKTYAAEAVEVDASPLQAQLARASTAFAASLGRRAALQAKEATATQLQAVDDYTASSEIPRAHTATPQLVQELLGDGAILAAQALRENAAGVERCALIAQKNSTRNAAGYLLMMLRQGQHKWIGDEQERSDGRTARPERHLVAV